VTLSRKDWNQKSILALLRDEAMEKLALDEEPSPLLQSAIDQIREQTATTATDQEISRSIVAAIE
jgi:hypothetical protein